MRNLISILSALILLAPSTLSAQGDAQNTVRFRDFELVQQRGVITVDFTLDIGARATKTGNTLTLIPVLTNGEHSEEFTPVVVWGKRARMLYDRRHIASPRTAETLQAPEVLTAKNGETIGYHATIAFADWMPGSVLLLEGVTESCCSATRTGLGLVADRLIVPESDFTVEQQTIVPATPTTTADRLAQKFPFVRSAAEAGSERFSRDGIQIFFHQGRHDIDQPYRDNRASLVDILSVVRQIQDSPDSDIDRIAIAGFASPEGTYGSNMRLSENRAEAVRKFIFDNSTLSSRELQMYIGGEDWEGLRELVVNSNELPDKQAVLDIIDRGGQDREARLKRLDGGETYRWIYRYIYPELRNAAYITVYYKNK